MQFHSCTIYDVVAVAGERIHIRNLLIEFECREVVTTPVEMHFGPFTLFLSVTAPYRVEDIYLLIIRILHLRCPIVPNCSLRRLIYSLTGLH